MATYFVNTEPGVNAGVSPHDEWIRRGIAATTGAPRYKGKLARIRRGDSILMYVNGMGLAAKGEAVDDEVIDAPPDQTVNSSREPEYHKRVRWDFDLRSNPISPAELRRLLGQTPLSAVQRVIKGERELARYLAAVAAVPTGDPAE